MQPWEMGLVQVWASLPSSVPALLPGLAGAGLGLPMDGSRERKAPGRSRPRSLPCQPSQRHLFAGSALCCGGSAAGHTDTGHRGAAGPPAGISPAPTGAVLSSIPLTLQQGQICLWKAVRDEAGVMPSHPPIS